MADDEIDPRAWIFSVCDTDGGPLDAPAYFAGYLMAECDRLLHTLYALQPCGLIEAKVVMTLPIELLEIVDLLAMECGFTTAFTGPESDEDNVPVTFTLGRDFDTITSPEDLNG